MRKISKNQLTLFAEDIRVSLSLLPGSREAKRMTVISGLNILDLYRNLIPNGLLPRMLLGISKWGSTRCFLTWKVKTTPGGRLLFHLAPSVPSIKEKECGWLPTPNARDGKDISRTTAYLAARQRHSPSLATISLERGTNWPDVAEVYAAAMGYPSKWCEVSVKDTETQ